MWQALSLCHTQVEKSLRWLFPEVPQLTNDDRLFLFVTSVGHQHLYSVEPSEYSIDKEFMTEHLNLQLIAQTNSESRFADKASWSYTLGATGRRMAWLVE